MTAYSILLFACSVAVYRMASDKRGEAENAEPAGIVNAQESRAVRKSASGGRHAVEIRVEQAETGINSVRDANDGGGLSDEIQEALDAEDYAAVSKLVPQALMAKSAEVKEEMIDALSTFGRKAVPELISFLGDPDGEIREKAMDEIKSAISDGEDLEIAQDVAVIMKSAAITDDSEMEDIAMNLNMINDNELILKTVVDIMENGASDLGKKWADDTYLFTTGEHYTSKADAERWIAENCDE